MAIARDPGKQKQSQTITIPLDGWFHIIPQNHSSKNSMVLAQKQTKISQQMCWENWISTYKRMKLDSSHQNQPQIDRGPQHKIWNTETARRKSI